MAWTTPMTAVDNGEMTAAIFNTEIRNNLNLMAPALAGATANQIFVTTDANAITTHDIEYAEVTASQSTTSSSYTNLSTVGPSVTVDSVEGQQVMVWIYAWMDQSVDDNQAAISVEVTGAASFAASNTGICLTRDGMTANNTVAYMASYLFDTTSFRNGSSTFTMKYRNGGGGTATFAQRRIMAMAL